MHKVKKKYLVKLELRLDKIDKLKKDVREINRTNGSK